MDADRFASFTRIVHDHSRRRFLTLFGIAAGGLIPLIDPNTTAAKKKNKKKKKSGKKSPALALAYECPGPAEQFGTYQLINRVAQVFVAERSGMLRRIAFQVENLESDSGDYVVQLLRVDDGAPLPLATHVLAGISIPEGDVPVGESTLTANFNGPELIGGTEYAAAIGRLVSHVRLGTHSGTGNVCAGQAFTSQGGGVFAESDELDLVVSVLVD
jgi:hypothetical protein